jgi:hypothetical protein
MIFLLPFIESSIPLHLLLLRFCDFATSCFFFCIGLLLLFFGLLCNIVMLFRGLFQLFLKAGDVESRFIVCPRLGYG